MQPKIKSISASLIGNILEYYDFALYGAFAPFISHYFFPVEGKISFTLIIFAFSFLMRPLGAFVFGFIGDTYGRKKAFGIPLMLMALFTLMIIFIPSYEEIGISASILLSLCRMGQGFCLGGEYGGAVVFSLEHNSNSKNLAFVSGLLGASVLFGALLANIISFIFTMPQFSTASWRIPFIIGSLIGFVGMWVRYNSKETPEFLHSKKHATPVVIILKQYPLSIIKALAISGLSGLLSSFLHTYINFLLVSTLKWSLNQGLLLTSFGYLIALFFSILSGIKIKKHSPMIVIKLCCLAFLFMILPCMYIIKISFSLAMISMFLLSAITGICWGKTGIVLYSLFPSSVRYTGVAFSDSIGRIIFSAPIPFLCDYLVKSFGYIYSSIIPIAFIIMIFIMLCYKENGLLPQET